MVTPASPLPRDLEQINAGRFLYGIIFADFNFGHSQAVLDSFDKSHR